MAKTRGDTLDSATAARVSQADKEGWVEFTRSIEKSIRDLVLPKSLKQPKLSAGGLAALQRTIQAANNKARQR